MLETLTLIVFISAVIFVAFSGERTKDDHDE